MAQLEDKHELLIAGFSSNPVPFVPRNFAGIGRAEYQILPHQKKKRVGSNIVRLTFTVDERGNGFCGTMLDFENTYDVSKYKYLVFDGQAITGDEVFEIKLRDCYGGEDFVISRNYFEISRSISKCAVPLDRFRYTNLHCINAIIFAANNNYSPSYQVIEFSNIGFKKKLPASCAIHQPAIFLVHGHDEEFKAKVQLTLSKLNLSPIVLSEEANRGMTIIEKFEKYSNVGFAVVMLSPDDKCLMPDGTETYRARQNVIFELGYFIGKINRSKVVAIYKKNDGKSVELLSDYIGVVYIEYDDKGAWAYKLVKEMNSVGYDVNANLLC